MNRRHFLKGSLLAATLATYPRRMQAATSHRKEKRVPPLDKAVAADWLTRWEGSIEGDSRKRYCDTENGEELGWLTSPFLNGFYHGYKATGDEKWIDRAHNWTEACFARAIKEPDGFLGWPKGDGGGGDSSEYKADSLLGEAMLLKPIVLMAGAILADPKLRKRWGVAAQRHITFAANIFKKWDSRGCWRDTKAGGLWIVPGFGIDPKNADWSAGFATRSTTGFSNPANKQNHIASWLLAMHDITEESKYLTYARLWFHEMHSRMRIVDNGKRWVWNYWDPAGPWDFKADGSPRHWVGVHPNGG